MGAVEVLEVTIQKSDYSMFHPHFYVLIFLSGEFPPHFEKYIDGGYQYSSDSYIYYSDADIFIQKLWKMAYERICIGKYNNASSNWQDNFICDIRPLVMPKGLY